MWINPITLNGTIYGHLLELQFSGKIYKILVWDVKNLHFSDKIINVALQSINLPLLWGSWEKFSGY